MFNPIRKFMELNLNLNQKAYKFGLDNRKKILTIKDKIILYSSLFFDYLSISSLALIMLFKLDFNNPIIYYTYLALFFHIGLIIYSFSEIRKEESKKIN